MLVLALVAASAPWMGSVSFSVQVPATMNKVVDMAAPHSGDSLLGPPAVVARPGGPGFILPGPQVQVLQKKLPFRATALGVLWRGEGPPPQIRTGRDGTSWTRWREVTDDPDMFDERRGTHFSALLGGHGARFAEVKPSKGIDARSVKVVVINTIDGPQRTSRQTRSASAATGKPEILPRAAWGAEESIRRDEGEFSRTKKIFLHHTATVNNDPDPAGTIRAIYSYHIRNRGFHDIGYNFLIDHRGRIYEGRYSGSAGEGGSPSGENANGMSVLGAHTKNHNAGSIGIAMVGNSDAGAPTRPAVDSLVRLSAWAADRHGIDPLGKNLYVDPETGALETLFNIAGHKDSQASITKCPGVILQSQLPSIRKRVEETIASTTAHDPPSMPTGTTMAMPSPSSSMTPNLAGDVSRSAVRVDLIFEGHPGTPRRTISVTPSRGSFNLTDASFEEASLAPGIYSVRAVAFDAQNRPSPVAQVADGYELRRASVLPALDGLVSPVINPQPARAGRSDLANALRTVIKVLGL